MRSFAEVYRVETLTVSGELAEVLNASVCAKKFASSNWENFAPATSCSRPQMRFRRIQPNLTPWLKNRAVPGLRSLPVPNGGNSLPRRKKIRNGLNLCLPDFPVPNRHKSISATGKMRLRVFWRSCRPKSSPAAPGCHTMETIRR